MLEQIDDFELMPRGEMLVADRPAIGDRTHRVWRLARDIQPQVESRQLCAKFRHVTTLRLRRWACGFRSSPSPFAWRREYPRRHVASCAARRGRSSGASTP